MSTAFAMQIRPLTPQHNLPGIPRGCIMVTPCAAVVLVFLPYSALNVWASVEVDAKPQAMAMSIIGICEFETRVNAFFNLIFL